MSRHCYFDTSALVLWAEASNSSADARAVIGRTAVETLFNDASVSLALSELTILEYSNSLITLWRTSSKPQFDQSWAEDNLNALMKHVADGRATVVSAPRWSPEQAIALMTVATRRNVGLKAWDSIHLVTAANWSNQLGQIVELVTCDEDFENFGAVFDFFDNQVVVFRTA